MQALRWAVRAIEEGFDRIPRLKGEGAAHLLMGGG